MMRILIMLLMLISFAGIAQIKTQTTTVNKSGKTESRIVAFGKDGNELNIDSLDRYWTGFKYAQFPGGKDAWNKFLVSNFKYPEGSRYKGMNEYVVVKFTVDQDGSLSDFKIPRALKECLPCDEEALRIAKLMPKWEPGQRGGKNARTESSIGIPFNYLK